jgi:4-hydroxy-tetrahydrodipicolinate reductase
MVGVHAVSGIVSHPDLELVGVYAHSPEKAGHDGGELCGIAPTGVLATTDADALLGSDADCVSFNMNSLRRVDAVYDDLERILRAGKNVVNTSWAGLVNPKAIPGDIHARLEAACHEGESSFYTSGIEPGYCSIGIALGALSMCENVRTVRMYEISNAAALNHPGEILRDLFGFGTPDASQAAVLQPGWSSSVWAPTVALVADGIGLELDDIVEDHELLHAEAAFKTAERQIDAGMVAGIRFQIIGRVGGEPRVIIDHITKLRDEDFPEHAFPTYGGYRVEIDGEPCLRIDLQLSSHVGDHLHAAYVATAMAAVNAIPQVCQAPPGVLTDLDLVPHPTQNVVR